MSVLQYQDYQGEVVFDSNHLVIRILHIDDFITTEVDNASQAQAAFAELVDDYIASCAELGRQPCKPFKGSFNVRMVPKLHKQVAFAAVAEGETLNGYVVKALEEKLHAGEMDAISNSVARAMAEYVIDRSQRQQEASAWQFLEMPVRAHDEWPPTKGVRVSVPTTFLKSWVQSHYGERVFSAWSERAPAAQPGGAEPFLIGPIRTLRSADR